MDRIIGQPRATGVLHSAIASGRMHHAWIFAGPAGVGKRTTAVELARLLLDPDAAPNLAGVLDIDPGGRVSTLIDAGTHPDLHVITKEMALHSENAQLRNRKLRNIPLDLLRERMIGGRTSDDKVHEAPAYRTAVLGHGKVFVIDEAELVDAVGQNALLKTLEEPPLDTTIILVTSRPERLLPTIRSRCQLVTFRSLPDDAMQQWLDRSGLEVTGDERAWIESFAEGSPGRALRAAEFGFHEWFMRLRPMLDSLDGGRFPAELGTVLAEIVDEYAKAWVKQHAQASKDAANKDGAGHVLALVAAHARTRLHEAIAAGKPVDRWTRAIDLVAETERQLTVNVNMKVAFENLVVQWAATPVVATA